MEILPRGEAAPINLFARQVVDRYENALAEDDREQIEIGEEIIFDGIMQLPGNIAPLYDLLSRSEVEIVRQVAATRGIREAFKCDPVLGGQAWNRLLTDSCPTVGEWALNEFLDYVKAIEDGLEHDRDLRPIYGDAANN